MITVLPPIPHVIGHRGAAAHAPENTLAGIDEAVRRGARMVEVDARLTADGVPVLFHDDTLDRTTNGVGPVDHALFSEVRRLDAGAWFGPGWEGERIPTLEDVIGLTGKLGLHLNIEIKALADRARETARVALEAAAALWPADRPVPLISSFRPDALEEARAIVPEWPRGLLLSGRAPKGWQALAERLDVFSVNIDHRDQDAASLAGFTAMGRPVLCYTVNDPARAARLFAWGAAAVFSDAPDAIAPP